MTVSFPDAFSINTSEKYILSIRLLPGGLSFSCSIPMVGNTFFFREVVFDHSKTYLSSLKEFFFGNEFMSWQYKKVNILCFTSHYVFVPADMYDASRKQELIQGAFLKPETMCLDNALSDKGHIVFSLERDIYEFLCRSFVNPSFLHHLTPALTLWNKQQRKHLNGQMFVLLNSKTIDVACLNKGELLFLNSFEYSKSKDVFYLLACIWRQVGQDQLKDEMSVFGNPDDCNSLMTDLRVYIQNVKAMDMPLEFYLLGDEASKASYDIISLSLCE
jgi:hypothetical protein